MSATPARSRSGSGTRRRSATPARVRLTPDERAQIDAAAEQAGLTVGAFIRLQCLGTPGPRAVRRPPVERAALAQLLGQLGKAGSNLNQIARALNMGQESPAEITAALGAIREAGLAIAATLRGKRP